MDLVITNATVVTMNRARDVLRDAEIVIQGNRLAKVGPVSRGTKHGVRRVIDVEGRVVMPGLIHGHLHACQTLCRNHADGLELLEWLRERIWPFEAAHTAESMRASADLTFYELIRSGATAALDMGSVNHYGSVFESAKVSGLRLVGGKCMMDAGQGVPMGLRETTRASMEESIALSKKYNRPADTLTSYAFAPRFVLSCTEELMKEVAVEARRLEARVHTHASENQTECQVVRDRVGADNVEYFEKIGLTGDDVTLAHCVWLTAREQKILATSKTHVVHCPSANLKLASGIAKIPELMDAGVQVALGGDGAPCNNNLDAFVEMRLAALLHKPRAGPLAMPPERVLEIATLGGARALGLGDEIGSLEEGKQADVIILDLNVPRTTPAGDDPMARIVYCAQSSDVRTVIVAGNVLVSERELMTLDEDQVRASAEEQAKRLVSRSQVA